MSAPNLQTLYLPLPKGYVYMLPKNDARTFLEIQDGEQERIRYWLGENPPSDALQWPRTVGFDQTDVVRFPNGVQGPIYLQSEDVDDGFAHIISSLNEAPVEVIL